MHQNALFWNEKIRTFLGREGYPLLTPLPHRRLGFSRLLCSTPPPTAFLTNQTLDAVEKVHSHFSKRLEKSKHLPYDERLAKLGLPTLELRRFHLGLIFCHKSIFSLMSVNRDDFFTLSSTVSTSGRKTNYPQFSNSVRFFVESVINVLNSLPPTVNSSSLETLKHTIRCADLKGISTLCLKKTSPIFWLWLAKASSHFHNIWQKCYWGSQQSKDAIFFLPYLINASALKTWKLYLFT